jgi:hypothetical protein
MAYVNFAPCTVEVEGQRKRGIKATCGQCGKYETRINNTTRSHGLDDDDIIERQAQHRFERNDTARRKEKDDKVVPINIKQEPPATETPRPSRDEKRIIFQKIDENYVGEKVGYAPGWSDEKVATDLGVPRAWVAVIRDENFGPEVDEERVKLLSEAAAVRDEIRALSESLAAMQIAFSDINAKAMRIERELEKLK